MRSGAAPGGSLLIRSAHCLVARLTALTCVASRSRPCRLPKMGKKGAGLTGRPHFEQILTANWSFAGANYLGLRRARIDCPGGVELPRIQLPITVLVCTLKVETLELRHIFTIQIALVLDIKLCECGRSAFSLAGCHDLICDWRLHVRSR